MKAIAVKRCLTLGRARASTLPLRPRAERLVSVKAEASEVEEQDPIPAGCSRYMVKLPKPLGIVRDI